ncbi:MAG: hypothetical protein ABI840_03910 [bacterium]
MKKNILISVFLIIVFSGLPRISFSQNGSSHKVNHPMLDGHDFIINNFIDNPFVTTNLSSGLGFATSLQTDIPLLRLGDTTTLKIDADISFVNGSFKYQHAIQDWAAIWINVSGIARLGTNTASIFVSGVTANTAFETGMLFRIKESKKSLFSSSIRIKNSSSTILNIYPFIRGLIDSTYPYATKNLVNTLNPLAGEVDLRAAYSPSKYWNILSYFNGGYGENIEINEIKNRFNYEFGASVSYNLNPGNNIPLAIGTGLKFNSRSPTLEYTKRLTQYYMFQLAYTGRKDFTVSLESQYARIPVNYQDITIKLSSFAFSWAYYF